jgi:hypothetical protein
MIRVFAYCLRFIHNSRKENCDKFTGYLSCSELQHSHDLIVKFTQQEAFHSDMHNLRKSSRLSQDSKLISLNPFIDKKGLLRVGGRLRHAPITYEQKHPLILPKNHLFWDLNPIWFGPTVIVRLLRVRSLFWPIRPFANQRAQSLLDARSATAIKQSINTFRSKRLTHTWVAHTFVHHFSISHYLH